MKEAGGDNDGTPPVTNKCTLRHIRRRFLAENLRGLEIPPAGGISCVEK